MFITIKQNNMVRLKFNIFTELVCTKMENEILQVHFTEVL